MGEVSGELLTMLVEEGVAILYYLFSSFSFSRLLGGRHLKKHLLQSNAKKIVDEKIVIRTRYNTYK